jgi:hypothetical protein
MNPNFPVYIPSKGRFDSRLTIKALDELGTPYRVVVEEQEFKNYSAVIDPKKLLVLDKRYQRDYNAFYPLRDDESRGPGPARNFIWDHAIACGAEWHWVVDYNIKSFHRLNQNIKRPVSDGTIFRCMEDFVLRYKNIAMAGPNYFMFASRKTKMPQFTLNTRIYSCNLIRNDTAFRWRGRYNEDTDLSLRMLKAGWCTVLFNAFLQFKMTTQTVGGGSTAEFYAKEGTLPKSQMLVDMHPDVSKLARRFGRWHHYVDYSGFKKNKLILRDDVKIQRGVDNYGMRLVNAIGERP